MKKNMILITLISGLLATGAFAGIFNWDNDEEDIAIKDLPSIVVKTISRVFPGGEIKKAEKDDNDESVIYKVKVKNTDAIYKVKLTAEGKLIKIKIDDDDINKDDENENEISAKDLPPVVKTAVLKIFPKGKIKDIDVAKEQKVKIYKVEVKNKKAEHIVVVNNEGKIFNVTEDTDNKDKD